MILEREKGKERKRERKRKKHQCDREISIGSRPSQPRYVPWPGIKPATFFFGGVVVCEMTLHPTEPPSQGDLK